MGNGGSNYSGVNNMAQQNFQNYNNQRNDFQNVLYSGLGTAASNDQNILGNAAGAYGNFINTMQGQLGGGPGGGSVDVSALQNIAGPGNPWAGQLGNDVRARENSVLPGFFDQIRSAQARLQNIQGGYNPGYTAQMSKLSRDQAQQAQKGILNTEIEIGKQKAAAAAAQAQFEMQKQMAIMGAQQSAAQAGAANYSRNAGLLLSGIGGLSSLYGATPGATGMYLNALGGNLNAGQAGAQGGLGQLMQYNPQGRPWWQTALGAAGGLAGAFGR